VRKISEIVNQKNFEYLVLADYYAEFADAWKSANSRILKFEALQDYGLDHSNPDYICFGENDASGFVKELLSFWNEEVKGLYSKVLDGEMEFFRLHFVDYPISEYLKYEYYSYYICESIGEHIKILENQCQDFDRDFVIFDSDAMFIQDYDASGDLFGAWRTKDLSTISGLAEQFSALFEIGVDYSSMYEGSNDIKRAIKSGIDF
jgi:hypothetical protein